MSAGGIAHSRWFWGSTGVVSLLCGLLVVVATHAAPGSAWHGGHAADDGGPDARPLSVWAAGRALHAGRAAGAGAPARSAPPVGASGDAAAGSTRRLAGRTGGPWFGLVRPGRAQGEVLFARAGKQQHGGPETARAARPEPYRPVPLAPGAQVWLTAPLADREPADYLTGISVEPEAFGRYFRAAEQRLGGVVDARAHMFELWLDEQGRAIRLRHYFSP